MSILLIHRIHHLADTESLATITNAMCQGQIAPEKRDYLNVANRICQGFNFRMTMDGFVQAGAANCFWK